MTHVLTSKTLLCLDICTETSTKKQETKVRQKMSPIEYYLFFLLKSASGFVNCELRVASCELRVELSNCELRVNSIKTASCELITLKTRELNFQTAS